MTIYSNDKDIFERVQAKLLKTNGKVIRAIAMVADDLMMTPGGVSSAYYRYRKDGPPQPGLDTRLKLINERLDSIESLLSALLERSDP